MKFRIARSALVDAVSQVSKAVSTRTTIPILTGIKVTAEEEGILFTGSNADLTIQVRVPLREEDKEIVHLERIGNTVLPGRIIGELVRKLPEDEVEWEVDERRVAPICSGQARFQLNAMDPEEYPRLPELVEDRKFSLPADLLQTMIRQTVFAVSTSEARGVLMGVLWQLEGGRLRLVATDSHRLSRREAEVEAPEGLTLANVIVPGKSLSEVGKILADRSGWVDIVVSDNQLLIETTHLKFFTRLLSGNYPDTDRVIPRGGRTELVLSTKELLESVDRASLISRDGRDNVIKWVVSDDGRVEVSSAAQDVGSVTEEVSARVSGEPMSISFNARYMIEALRAVDSEEIRILLTGPMTPFSIRPVDSDDSLHLIVPIRTR